MKTRTPRHVFALLLLLAVAAGLTAANRSDVDEGIQQFQRGAYEKALTTFRTAYDSEPISRNVFAAVSLFMIAKCDFELGNYDQVVRDSRLFERNFPESRYLPDVMFERAKALAMKKQFYPAMLSAIRILSLEADEGLNQDVMTFCDDLARYYLLPSDFEMLSPLIVGEASLNYLKLLWAERCIALGDYAGANGLLQEVKTGLTHVSFVNKYKNLIKYLNKSAKNEEPEITVAVVLPLTGKYSETGNELLEGIKYAYESNRNKSKKRVNIVIVDTESKIQTGLSNLKALLEMQEIAAVIGPLTSEMAVSMAPLCEYAGVPLIAPTATADDLTKMGASIFQLNPEQQQRARALADYATDRLNCRRFGIIAPTTEDGIAIANAFMKSVEKNGGQVVSNVWYNGTPTDINDKLSEMKDDAEYLPPYFSYLKGFYEARALGMFDTSAAPLTDSLLAVSPDSLLADTMLFTAPADSLPDTASVAVLPEPLPPDTTFILETLWPADSTVYDILVYGTASGAPEVYSDSLMDHLKKQAKHWLSGEVTLEEKYNTHITDSLCIFLSELRDSSGILLVRQLLRELDPVTIDAARYGDYHFSRLVSDTIPLQPYIDMARVESLKRTLASTDSLSALWLLAKTDTLLFPYIFPVENFGIDAVYMPIPESHIKYIAPQWARNRFGAHLLGDGNWYNTTLLARYRSNIDSMTIASDYYWDSKDIELRRFAKYFTQKTSLQPNRIHIYGYESMDLLMRIIEDGGQNAAEIRKRLNNLEGTYGLIRRITFDPDHPRSNSGVRLIRFYKGNLTPVN
ncbi:MAG: penicillin-binding protein activator [Candidatus Marinimicrobia bacterium]|nr:penicillin-binding protein activator [Candidatus Neomarinimicrobiota bacterium]